jgi:cell fate regulator YaaT (PSP1 superfamily)
MEYLVIFKNVLSIQAQNDVIEFHFKWLREVLLNNYEREFYYNVRESIFKIGDMYGYTIELSENLIKEIEQRPEINYVELNADVGIQF